MNFSLFIVQSHLSLTMYIYHYHIYCCYLLRNFAVLICKQQKLSKVTTTTLTVIAYPYQIFSTWRSLKVIRNLISVCIQVNQYIFQNQPSKCFTVKMVPKRITQQNSIAWWYFTKVPTDRFLMKNDGKLCTKINKNCSTIFHKFALAQFLYWCVSRAYILQKTVIQSIVFQIQIHHRFDQECPIVRSHDVFLFCTQ